MIKPTALLVAALMAATASAEPTDDGIATELELTFPDAEVIVSDITTEGDAITQLLNSRATSNTRDYVTAAEKVAADAAAGKPIQQYLVAIFSEDHSAPGVFRISKDTRERYLKASKGKINSLAKRKNNPLAWYLLSLENNDPMMLLQAVDGGNIQALNAYGTILLTDAISNPAITPSQFHSAAAQAVECFERTAGVNDMNGIYNLGMCYMRGYGVDENPKKACELFLKAARHNHPEAINNIGGFLRDGILVKQNIPEAVKWFKRSADLGNLYGMINYALALQRGEGVEQNLKVAAEIFRQASQYDSPEAINAYGMCLLKGEGVEKNEAEALVQFRRSATFGYPTAMENLSSCYERGLCGLERDAHTAFIWKVKARAARGDRNAALWLKQNGHDNK